MPQNMTNPSSEEEGILREWAPLEDLLRQIPLKAQRGLFTHDLSLTCVDVLPEYCAVGTNLGLVYWYGRRNHDLQRLRCENSASSVTCVKVISTVDYMVAAGNDQGGVTVFQIPKIPPDNLPESMKPKKNKQVERYTISGLHTSAVTAIEWSMNGMKLFSGDKNGLVVLTEIDFYMHLSKSVELLNEKYEIVQLSYSQQLLLVSTLYRSILCHRDDRWKVIQVGQKERKMLGRLGATFCPGSGRPQELVVYASRPGLRIWLADKNGVVQQTLIYKDALAEVHPEVPLINPLPDRLRPSRVDPQFGPLHSFHSGLLVTYSADTVYILDPNSISVAGAVSGLRGVLDVSVTKDEIFVLEGGRSLIRLAYAPEAVPPLQQVQGYRQENHQDASFMSIPVSLSDNSVTSSLRELTSKLKGSAIVPAIPFNKIHLFNKSHSSEPVEHEDVYPVITADEAMELPPIVAISSDCVIDLNIEKTQTSSDNSALDENKVYKEYFNRSQRGNLNNHRGSNISLDSSRAELLEKIGEQQFEDILFRPKVKKNSKKIAKNKHLSGLESGSDSMSTSTNSIRSVNSDSEDAINGEQQSSSADCGSTPTRSGINHLVSRSSSEDTLVKIGEHSSVSYNDDHMNSDQPCRPDKLHPSNDGDYILNCVQPDLRSPDSIERDVADKERLLAKVLNLDTLYIDRNAENEIVEGMPSVRESDVGQEKIKSVAEDLIDSVTDAIVPDESENHSSEEPSDEKLSSYSSVLSYGPPSGSSAPPSTHASLDIYSPEQRTDPNLSESSAIERADKWVQFKTPCSITSVSICRHYICCVDSRDSVFFSGFNGLGLKWQKLDNKGRQVIMSQSGDIVWKIQKNVAYALKEPSYKGPFGAMWMEAAGDVQCVAVGDTTAWTVSLDGRIYLHKNLTRERPCSTPSPLHCIFPVTRICCFKDTVWVLTTTGKVLWRSGISTVVPEGKEWTETILPSVVVVDIALGCHGTGWIIDSKNMIYFSVNFREQVPRWWQVLVSDYVFQDSTALEQFRSKLTDSYLYNLRPQSTVIVASGEDTLWISEKMATNIHMNKTEFTGHQWNKVNLRCLYPMTKWQQVRAEGIFEDKGQLWMLSKDGNLFCTRPNSNELHSLPLPSESPVVCLAATMQCVWLLNVRGEIHIRQGISDTCYDGFTWDKLNLSQIGSVHFTHVSCGSDVIWACDSQGDIYMAVGSPQSVSSSTFPPAWIPIDDKPQNKSSFIKVYVGPLTYMVWALDVKKRVYVREGIFTDYLHGTSWVLVSGIEAVALSISSTAVWALDPSGNVYRRYGISETNYIGDYWKKIPGSVSSLTASMNDELWAIDKKGNLLRHGSVIVELSSQHPGPKIQGTQTTADGDWEVI